MSNDTNDDMANLKMDVALLRQEVYYLKESMKNMTNIFRWALMLTIGALLTAFVNFVIAGGIAP